jgi:hypothetical protein
MDMPAHSKTPRPMPPQLVANAGKGRKPGVPNKVTRQVREAFALLLDQSANQLREWLYQVGRTDPVRGLDMAIRLAEVSTGKVRTVAECFAAKYTHASEAESAEDGEVPGVPERSARTREEVSARFAHTREAASVFHVVSDATPPHPIRIELPDDGSCDMHDHYNPT